VTHVSPLPAKQPEDRVTEDDYGTPWSEYVRKIEFVDAEPPGPKDAPVHVMRRVLFDGVISPAIIDPDGMTVDVGSHDATVVTMHVHKDDVQIGHMEDGKYVPHLIGGRRVCTPVGEGWAWVPVEKDSDWIVCSFYVAEVHAR